MSWSYGGQTISQPGVIVQSDNSGISAPANTNTRELVLIGKSGGGKPKTVLSFSDPTAARNVLQSGEGLTAVLRAMNPSTDPARTPGTVKFVRVDPAEQSIYNVLNSATTVAALASTGYGLYTKQISTQVQTGTLRGLKGTVTLGTTALSQDNIYQSLLTIQYTGSDASALTTVSNSAGSITGSSGALASETLKWTASFATYTTVQQLINYINAQAGWLAVITTASPNSASTDALDDQAATACKTTAATVTGTLQALINWYNTTGIVTAARGTNTGLLPTAMSAPAYMTGGTNGTTTNDDWAAAYTALQNEPLARILVPITGAAAIHAMGDAHCKYMSQSNIRNDRVQIIGGVAGETPTQALARAQALNSRRTELIWPGIQDVDPITFALTTYPPYMVAAQAAAILSSLAITNAMTRQAISCKGLEGNLQSTLNKSDYDSLVDGGVTAIKFFQNSQGNAFRFVRSVTTWLQDTNLVNVEISVVCNEDYVNIMVGDAVDALIGQDGSPIGAGNVNAAIDATCRRLFNDKIIVGDTLAQAYNNIQVQLSNGIFTASYNATIPAPMNFGGITTKFGLYSSAVAAS